VVDKQPPNLSVVHVTAFPQGTVFSNVTGYLTKLNERLQTLYRVYIDQTGLGGPTTVLAPIRDPRRQALGSRTGGLRSKERNPRIPSCSSS